MLFRSADADELKVFTGGGISGRVDNKRVLIGNKRLLEQQDIVVPQAAITWMETREHLGETPVLVVADQEVIGSISIADTIRPDALGAIRALQAAKKRVVMLTGDNPRTAKAIADQLGLDEYRAQLMPEDKVEAIRFFRSEGHIVAMVGDGINDTPALAEADLGIAMGAAGTDAAIETADLTLMSDSLDKVTYALRLGRATLMNIRQNVAFAVAVVFLLVVGVLGQKVFLATGMLAHEASVMLVILNAMRLRSWR